MHYSEEELRGFGASVGCDVRVDSSVRIFGGEGIRIGNNVRIDAFSILSAGEDGIEIGDCVHIASGCYLYGSGGRVVLEDFAGLSSRVSVYTASDDYVNGHLTNPTVPTEYRQVTKGDVVLRKHAIVGAGCVILPGVTLGVGASIGALTCLRKSVEDFAICVSGAAQTRVIGKRSRRLLELEAAYRRSLAGGE